MTPPFLSHFTPSLMSHEALEAIFVQREQLAERLVVLTRESVLTPSKHYTLLIGPRGIGKTHLIALLYHRITAMADLHNCLRIAWLREEEWGVTSFLELLLRIFTALIEEYKDNALAAQVAALYDLPPQEAQRQAEALLREYCGTRPLLLLMENLDELFHELGDSGQKHFRAYLQQHPFCTIVATAQSLFSGVSRQTSPFYGFFRIRHLEELRLEEAVQLLIQIAHYEQQQSLVAFLQSPRGRARVQAIAHLAGGNHRVYVILAQFLTRASLDELVEPFLSMLDDLTPYYQARMAWLSPQQRKMVNFLCDNRAALPVKDIAQRCFMSQQTAASQLQKLQQMGYVCSTVMGRESFYELREPLMRMGVDVKKHRGQPIRLFVEFLRYWYSPGELEARLEMLPSHAALDREYLSTALQSPEITSERQYAEAFMASEYQAGALAKRGNQEKSFPVLETATKRYGNSLQGEDRRNSALSEERFHEDAIAVYDEVVERFGEALAPALQEQVARALVNKGYRLGVLGRSEDAIAVYDEVVERFGEALAPAVQEQVARALVNKGYRLGVLGRSEEEITVYDEVVERFGEALVPAVQEQVARALVNKGVTLGVLGRSEEEITVYDEVVERFGEASVPALQEEVARALFNKGYRLGMLGRSEDAIAVYDEVVERFGEASVPAVQEQVARALFNKGYRLGVLGRSEDAIAVYDEVVERFGEASVPAVQEAVARALFNKGYRLGVLGRSEDAIAVYDEVVERFGEALAPAVQEQVARALVNKGEALGQLGYHTEAIQAYNAALAYNPTDAVVAIACYNSAAALFALHRWDDALNILDDALVRFPQDHDQRDVTPADAGLRLLLTSTDAQTWPERLATLLMCYAKHGALASLGRGLVRGIATLSSPMVSNAAAQTWRDIWQERGAGYDELTIPLRLLDAAVRYRETHDQRVLLRLPMEERKVLEQILGEGSPGTA